MNTNTEKVKGKIQAAEVVEQKRYVRRLTKMLRERNESKRMALSLLVHDSLYRLSFIHTMKASA